MINVNILLQVGVIILYDHVHPVGAFAKNAPIDVSHILVILFSVLTKHYRVHIPYSTKFWWWKILASQPKFFPPKVLNLRLVHGLVNTSCAGFTKFFLPIACLATNHQKLTLPKFCAIRYRGWQIGCFYLRRILCTSSFIIYLFC